LSAGQVPTSRDGEILFRRLVRRNEILWNDAPGLQTGSVFPSFVLVGKFPNTNTEKCPFASDLTPDYVSIKPLGFELFDSVLSGLQRGKGHELNRVLIRLCRSKSGEKKQY
jgi:hypothetical protein